MIQGRQFDLLKVTREPRTIQDTAQLMSRASQVLAYSSLDWIVPRPLYGESGQVFPHFCERAHGCEIVDTTGQSFVDWVNGAGPVLLGYGHPEVDEAIRSMLVAGPTVSLMHPIQVEVASMLTQMVPCAEMVAFAKNGSDVLEAAVRVARVKTNRQIILQFGMHGFHDWYQCLNPAADGIPNVLKSLVYSFPYNDLDALEALFDQFSGNVAAVVMEPVRDLLPLPGYLEGVRELTEKHGSLLIFDEVVTAFRLANGGAQEFFGVIPDLACLGKSIANGMPLSALVGRREYMQFFPRVASEGTFRGETLSLAAARAVLGFLWKEPVAERLQVIGSTIREAFVKACAYHDVRCSLNGPPARMSFHFENDGSRSAASLHRLFLQECLKRGILTNGHLLASYAHDAEAIDRTITALNGALQVVSEAVHPIRSKGNAFTAPRAHVSVGFIDFLAISEQGDALNLSGWMLLEDSAPDAIEFVSAGGVVQPAERVKRPDLLKAVNPSYPIASPENGGYSAALQARDFWQDHGWVFTIQAILAGKVVFRCRVWGTNDQVRLATARGSLSTDKGVLQL